MTKLIKSGDVIRYTYSGNRYTVQAITNGVQLRSMGKATGMDGGILSFELLERMRRDGVIDKEDASDD